MASLTTLTKRAGGFSPPDPDRCQHYARFLQNITRGQADAIFGSMFFMVVVLLVIASGIYERYVHPFTTKACSFRYYLRPQAY